MNIKLTYFYRPKMRGVHSIETVFDIIRKGLPSNISQSEFICTPKWKRYHSFFQARKYQGDINHITGDIHQIAFFLNKHKTIVTVHDVGRYERDLKGFKKRLFKLIWLDLPLRQVELITTISEFTKQKLVDLCNIPPDKIVVIPNPAPEDFFFSPKSFPDKNPAILQIGSGNNKNIYRLIEAIKGSDFRLILIRRKNSDLEDLVKAAGIQYEWHSDITREEVFECYKKCDIVFFASEYEGFGVPILEANIVGRPVITSTITAMPYVAGKAAVMVDPFSVQDIKDGLNRIRYDSDVRSSIIEQGVKNCERFSRAHIISEYHRVYNKLLVTGSV